MTSFIVPLMSILNSIKTQDQVYNIQVLLRFDQDGMIVNQLTYLKLVK